MTVTDVLSPLAVPAVPLSVGVDEDTHPRSTGEVTAGDAAGAEVGS